MTSETVQHYQYWSRLGAQPDQAQMWDLALALACSNRHHPAMTSETVQHDWRRLEDQPDQAQMLDLALALVLLK